MWTPLIATHAAAAMTSLLVGGYQLTRRVRGDAVHRRLGWLWVAAMTFVVTSSFAIREIRHGRLSLLHVLSVVTLVSLAVGLVAIRRGNVDRHRAAMRGSWLGLVGAFGAAVAVPSRRIPTFAVTEPAEAAGAAVAVLTVTVGLIWAAQRMDRSARHPDPPPATPRPRKWWPSQLGRTASVPEPRGVPSVVVPGTVPVRSPSDRPRSADLEVD